MNFFGYIFFFLFTFLSAQDSFAQNQSAIDPVPNPQKVETLLVDSLMTSDKNPPKAEFIKQEDENFLNSKSKVESKSVTNASNIMNMLYGTVFVCGLILAMAVILKFLQKKSGKFLGVATGKLKMIDQQNVGMRSKVAIIEALGKKYLIGISSERIQLLADLDFFNEEQNESEEPNDLLPMNTPSASVQTLNIESGKVQNSTAKAAERVRERLKSLRKQSGRG